MSPEDNPVAQGLGRNPCENDETEQDAGDAQADAVETLPVFPVEERAGNDTQQQCAGGHERCNHLEEPHAPAFAVDGEGMDDLGQRCDRNAKETDCCDTAEPEDEDGQGAFH